ncbi:MAG: ATP-binding protein [Candidatus Binatia bacterium]|nr:ATP-binding protein [Candidatus Binatia bacterium]
MEASESIFLTDRCKLKFLVKNLVTNALKFTAEGGVQVTAGRTAEWYEVSARDTGAGTPVLGGAARLSS